MLKQLNNTMSYIEHHLLDDNVIECAIQNTNVSSIHFKNIFFFLTGMTLNEYVKNRRLSLASQDLINGEKVTDIAFKYGYQSLDGFSRSFKNWCGFLPSEVIKRKESKVFPKFNFTVTVKGGNSMECRIIEKPAFTFAGVSKRVPMQFEGVNNAIVELANSITPAQRKEMHRLQNIEPFEVVNVSYNSDTDFKKEEGYLTHMIGVLTTSNDIHESLNSLSMSQGLWAVFPCEGEFPKVMQDTMARIYSEWFMSVDYQLKESLSFSFTKTDPNKQGFAYSEIWIPVVKK